MRSHCLVQRSPSSCYFLPWQKQANVEPHTALSWVSFISFDPKQFLSSLSYPFERKIFFKSKDHCFVDCPSVWVCPMFSHDLESGHASLARMSQKMCRVLPVPGIEAGDTGLSHHWWKATPSLMLSPPLASVLSTHLPGRRFLVFLMGSSSSANSYCWTSTFLL